MENSESYFKKNFANFQSKYDEQSYEVHKEKKQKLFAEVKGNVLEIGPGTGVNFLFLKDKDISWTGLEPNSAMNPFLLKAAKESGIEARLFDSRTENIDIADNEMDFVISTEVLCSVSDLLKSLNEIMRVLKPGGKFLFLEHVVDKKNIFRKTLQKTVPYTPWKFFSDGCNPGRDIGDAIMTAGFEKVEYTEYMQEGSGIIQTINRPHIYGWAAK